MLKGKRGVKVELVLVQADGQSRTIPLDVGRHVIGRAKEAELRIPVDIVSRRHCEIQVGEDGIVVRDLQSSNGTYVNCQRIDAEEELGAGDLIAVGPAVFVVRIDGEPEEIDPIDAYEDGAPSVASFGAEGAEADGETASGAPSVGPAPPSDASEESSILDFNFSDLDDDEEQPSL
jgi:pSer/pThr/pTyr-binding forkhead associated (FHA) protein